MFYDVVYEQYKKEFHSQYSTISSVVDAEKTFVHCSSIIKLIAQIDIKTKSKIYVIHMPLH